MKDEIIRCLENNDIITMTKLMSDLSGNICFNLSDIEIYNIFKSACNKDSTLAFNILYPRLENSSIIYR